ncbi:MAG: SDR family oxidoreductase [Thaumarchaeota archaeon]|nr:SDR family oxidoreductase [Nitrososphaerota archaeon]
MHPIIRNDIANLQKVVKDHLEGGQSILITGGAGFLGSWLCDSLVANAKVACYDNLSTGKPGNVSHLKGNKNFVFKSVDVASKWNTNQKFDLILHLASRPSPDDYQKHPVETLAVSTQGTRNVLELARRSDSRILFASTSEVYGDPAIIPTPETYWGNVNPIGLRSCYDEGKRVGEAMCMAYHRQYGVDTRIVRIFNTYGPRIGAKGAYGRAVPRFIVQAINGKPVTVYGDGKQTRSFCYVTDTVSAMIRAVLGKKGKGEVFNVGNPREVSILDLAKTIIRITKSKSKIVYLAEAPDDPQRRCPDISKARSVLNWSPRVGLNEGLKRTISWFRSESN